MGTGKWATGAFVGALLAALCFGACSGESAGGTKGAAGAADGGSSVTNTGDGGASAESGYLPSGDGGTKAGGGGGGKAGGDGGKPGDGGAGTAGGGGETDTVRGTDCNEKPFTLDAEIVRRCVLLAGCTQHAATAGTVSQCVASWPTFLSYHFYSGPGQAGHPEQPSQNWQWLPCTDAPLDSCADVEACVASAKKPDVSAETCDGSKSGAACVGDVERYCSPGGHLYTHDCASQGLTCFTGADDLPNALEILDCVPGGCGSAPPESQDTCDGDDLLIRFEMEQGDGARVHCPDYGFKTCKVDVCSN